MDSDDDDEDYASVEAMTRVTGYFRHFIEYGLLCFNINAHKCPLLFQLNYIQLINLESTTLRIIVDLFDGPLFFQQLPQNN